MTNVGTGSLNLGDFPKRTVVIQALSGSKPFQIFPKIEFPGYLFFLSVGMLRKPQFIVS